MNVPLVHNFTIYLFSPDFRNIDDQCRGPNVKDKNHLDWYLTSVHLAMSSTVAI